MSVLRLFCCFGKMSPLHFGDDSLRSGCMATYWPPGVPWQPGVKEVGKERVWLDHVVFAGLVLMIFPFWLEQPLYQGGTGYGPSCWLMCPTQGLLCFILILKNVKAKTLKRKFCYIYLWIVLSILCVVQEPPSSLKKEKGKVKRLTAVLMCLGTKVRKV